MKEKKRKVLYKGLIDRADGEYGMINRATLHELSLRIPVRNTTARMVYILLLTYANKDGICWPSHDTLSRILNVNRDAIVKAFNTLRELEFIITKYSPKHKSLKVQVYSVPHKLNLPDVPKDEKDDPDDFPLTEAYYSASANKSGKNHADKCMPEHTSTAIPKHTDECMPEPSRTCMSEDTQKDKITRQEKRQVEKTRPPIVNYSPPSSTPDIQKEKPTIPLDEKVINDHYEYGTKLPFLDSVKDDFIREQSLEIQSIFAYTLNWNLYWGFDISDLSFTKKDVSKANELLSFNSLDEILEDIEAYAELLGKPDEVVDFAKISDYLLHDFYQDWGR